MSALPVFAKPRRIKASHRRRRKVAAGHRLYIMNNPLAGTDPTGYTSDCGVGNSMAGDGSGCVTSKDRIDGFSNASAGGLLSDASSGGQKANGVQTQGVAASAQPTANVQNQPVQSYSGFNPKPESNGDAGSGADNGETPSGQGPNAPDTTTSNGSGQYEPGTVNMDEFKRLKPTQLTDEIKSDPGTSQDDHVKSMHDKAIELSKKQEVCATVCVGVDANGKLYFSSYIYTYHSQLSCPISAGQCSAGTTAVLRQDSTTGRLQTVGAHSHPSGGNINYNKSDEILSGNTVNAGTRGPNAHDTNHFSARDRSSGAGYLWSGDGFTKWQEGGTSDHDRQF